MPVKVVHGQTFGRAHISRSQSQFTMLENRRVLIRGSADLLYEINVHARGTKFGKHHFTRRIVSDSGEQRCLDTKARQIFADVTRDAAKQRQRAHGRIGRAGHGDTLHAIAAIDACAADARNLHARRFARRREEPCMTKADIFRLTHLSSCAG